MRPFSQGDVETEQHVRPAGRLTIGHVAHELNSLLDGTMRSLSLAQRSIDDAGPGSANISEHVVERLRFAQDGMQRMAMLLDRAMKSPRADVALFGENQTLSAQVGQVMQTIQPLANEYDIELDVHVSPKAASVPSATLGSVILNGMRNAIQACVANQNGPRCVELSIMINCSGHLHIVVSDSGAGLPDDFDFESRLPRDGHGFGLDLSRRIVHELGGELRLMSVPFGTGAILEVTVPLRRLKDWGERPYDG